MVGTGLRNLAAENDMTVSNGVAYGVLKGYATTLNEGDGYKRICISTRFPDAAQKDALMAKVNEYDLRKEYRVTSMKIAMNGIIIVFHDNPGTMAKILAFIDWFYPLLAEFSAYGDDVCPECGFELTGGTWKLVNGMAVHVHEGCARSLESKIDRKNEDRKSGGGSYGLGFLGALLGAILGAVIWGLVASFGYISAIIGFVIGFLAEKGYNLLRGKQGKGKIVILIIVVIIGVLLGNLIGDGIAFAQALEAEGVEGSFELIPVVMMYAFANEPGYLTAFLGNLGLGLLFAGIGVFSLLRKAGKEVADDKIITLK